MLKSENLSYISGAFSDRGAVKKLNQDKICIRTKSVDNGEALIAVVCGGMGGMARGDVAANTVIREFAIWFRNHLEEMIEEPRKIMKDWRMITDELNERIWGYGKQKGIKLGTTMTTILFLPDGRYYTANVGNNRIYRITDNGLQQDNEKTPGKQPKVYMGSYELVEPCFANDNIHAGESLLLCTDGFYRMLKNKLDKELIETSYEKDEDIRKKLEEMIHEMTARGVRDNLSAILVKAN